MTKGAEFPHAVSIFFQILEDAQWLAFSVDPKLNIPFVPSWFSYVLHPFSWTHIHYNYLVSTFWTFFSVLMINISLMIYVTRQFQKGRFTVLWPLVLLRYLSTVLTTVLFEPLVAVFFAAVNCERDDAGNLVVASHPDVPCAGSHVPLVALGCLGIVLIVPFGLLINYVFVESDPSSRNPHAKAHGYCELIYMIAKMTMVVVEETTQVNSHLTSLFIVLPALIFCYSRYQPYLHQPMTILRVGIFTAAFLSAIVSLAAHSHDGETNTPVPIVLLALSIPTGLSCGYGIVVGSRYLIVGRVMRNLREKMQMEMEMQTRDIEGGPVARSVDGKPPSQLKRRNSIIRSVVVDSGDGAGTGVGVVAGGGGKTGLLGSKESVQKTLPRSQLMSALSRWKTVAGNKKKKHRPVFWSSSEAEIACRFLKESVCDVEALEIMRAVFDEAMLQYPKHPAVALSYAFYLANFDTDASSASYYVEMAQENSPPLDVRFRIFMELREHEQATRAEDLAMSSFNVASYVEFQSLQNHAINSHLQSLLAMKAFWQGMATNQVNVDTVSAYMIVINATQSRATAYYKKLLERFPQSKQLNRLYAKYALTVLNNPELGAQLLSHADDVEFKEQQEAQAERGKPDSSSSAHPRPATSDGNLDTYVHGSVDLEAPASSDPLDVSGKRRYSPRLSQIAASMSGDAFFQGGQQASPEPFYPGIEPLFEEGIDQRGVPDGDAPVNEGKRFRIMASKSVENVAPAQDSQISLDAEDAPVSRWRSNAARSVASSQTSTRDLRKVKTKQIRMEFNFLKTPDRYALVGRLWVCALLGLLIANYTQSSQMFQGPKTFLNTLRQQTRSRRICLSQSILVRQLWSAGKAANSTTFNTTSVNLLAQIVRQQTLVLPVLFDTGRDVSPVAQVVMNTQSAWNSPRVILDLDPYGMAMRTTESLERIMQYGYDAFANTSTIEQDVEVRMWFDTTLKICDDFSAFSDQSLVNYRAGSASRIHVIVALLVVVVLVLMVSTGLYAVGLFKTRRQQRDWLAAIKTIPKSHVKRITADLEEEIEELFEMEGMEDRTQNNIARSLEGKLKRWVLARYAAGFLLTGLGLAVLAVSLFIPPLMSSHNMDEIASVIHASNNRRYDGQMINYLSQELAAHDAKTWAPYAIQRELEIRIKRLQDDQATALDGTSTTPSLLTYPSLWPYTRDGGVCMRSIGCDGRPYNPATGFTQALVMKGTTYLIDTLLGRARNYLDSGDYRIKNPDMQLILSIEPDIADGLETVDGLLVAIAAASSATYSTAVDIL
ncbi:hypothetical protein HKX48_000836, partial [Thoreauomyces humboldtii]